MPEDHKLWTLPNVILTPHIAVADAPNVPDRQFNIFLEHARAFAAGEAASCSEHTHTQGERPRLQQLILFWIHPQ